MNAAKSKKERAKVAAVLRDAERDGAALAAYTAEKQRRRDKRNPSKRPSVSAHSGTGSFGVPFDLTSPGSASAITESTGAAKSTGASKRSSAVASIFNASSSASQKKAKKRAFQSSLVTTMSKNNPLVEQQLHLAIQKLCTVYAITPAMPRSDTFRQVLSLARQTNSTYQPPTKQELHGSLLVANYDAYQAQSLTSLCAKAKIFGISIFGDGATIVKVPLFNVLACSPDNPQCVLDVVDCSDHCAAGGKKDAYYIAMKMLPKMKEVDPCKSLFHLIAFDGASNVQKAGVLMSQHFPRCTVIHSKEHVVHLVVKKVFELRPMKEMCEFCKKV